MSQNLKNSPAGENKIGSQVKEPTPADTAKMNRVSQPGKLRRPQFLLNTRCSTVLHSADAGGVLRVRKRSRIR